MINKFLHLVYGAPLYFLTMTVPELREAADRCTVAASLTQENDEKKQLAIYFVAYAQRIEELNQLKINE